jgi:hypothetical protein
MAKHKCSGLGETTLCNSSIYFNYIMIDSYEITSGQHQFHYIYLISGWISILFCRKRKGNFNIYATILQGTSWTNLLRYYFASLQYTLELWNLKGRRYLSWTEKLSKVLRNHSVRHNTSVRTNRTLFFSIILLYISKDDNYHIWCLRAISLWPLEVDDVDDFRGGRIYNKSHCQQTETLYRY